MKAFLPYTTNFQTVGNRVLVPRPYAPRMRPEDAADVLKSVFATNSLKLPKLDNRWHARRGLQNSSSD